MKRNRGFKYLICPDKPQLKYFLSNFGCCRFVYNHVLEEQIRLYKTTGGHMAKHEAFKWMTSTLKPKYPFLKEVDSLGLMNTVFNLDTAYKNFFEGRSRFPGFKSKKHSKASYTINITNGNIHFGEDYIILPKVGIVKAVIHRLPPKGYSIKSATVSMDHTGRLFCSLCMEYEDETPAITSVADDRVLGLDYASSGLYVDSEGTYAGMPKYYKDSQKRLARAQKKLSGRKGFRKGETKSANYLKQEAVVNKIYRKSANQRKDFLHKKSTEIANQYDFVGVEDIDMKEIASAGSRYRLGKATYDNGFGMFRQMLAYKLEDKGGALIKTDKWFASSQLCSKCSHRNPETKDLKVTEWTCPVCGTHHDRNTNAAKNIKAEALRILTDMMSAV